jgi:CMP-N,N'-diacetyllegionaminic acid synthase
MAMSLLAIIPARGGSKGIPRKNIKNLCGKPLIAWTIEVAKQVGRVDDVFVSTDDEEIAQISESLGVKVPFLRPLALASDESPAILTALQILETLPKFDEVIWLQPTSPLRSVEDVNGALELAQEFKGASVVSVSPVKSNPNWMYKLDDLNMLVHWMDGPLVLNRQDLPQAYVLNGAIYWARVNWLKKQKAFISNETLGYVMPIERSIDIDSLSDWKFAELLMQQGQ